ncbi:MAG: ribosome silencing factor [bacterium]|nr:ribosome silencing factor [bacterium]
MASSESEKLAAAVARVAHEHQAEGITVMDLRGLSPVTDFFVICSGTSDRLRQTLCDVMKGHGRQVGQPVFRVSGYETSTWILLDFIDIVVHVFAPEYREYYDLELLWGDAPRIEWQQSASA